MSEGPAGCWVLGWAVHIPQLLGGMRVRGVGGRPRREHDEREPTVSHCHHSTTLPGADEHVAAVCSEPRAGLQHAGCAAGPVVMSLILLRCLVAVGAQALLKGLCVWRALVS